MPPLQGDTAVAQQKRPRSRKSIAHMPSPDVASMDKENMTIDTSAIAAKATSKLQKRSRSKSIGPGGLDALNDEAVNRRKSVAAPPKSILKPVIPLSPLKEIPARKITKATRSPSRSPTRKSIPINTNGKVAAEAGLLGAPPASPSKSQRISSQPVVDNGPDPLDDELAAEEERKKQKAEALKQREARRKSMANRRVSFAPEATLHTWDMLEEMHDSTTSTSTSNSRRASEMSNMDETPSTPSEESDIQVSASPANQRAAHQKKRRRRSSGIPPMNFNNPDDTVSSSPVTGSSDVSEDDSGDEVVGQDVFSAEQEDAIISGNVDQSQDDEDGDASMEMAGDEITAAFKPWSQQMMKTAMESRELWLRPDQEKINPFSPAFKGAAPIAQASPARSVVEDEDMSMDMTRAVGGIMSTARSAPLKAQGRRQSVRARRRSSASSFGGETMEFTTALGGIQPPNQEQKDTSQLDSNEDMSMEFTAVLGGIQGRIAAQQQAKEAALSSTIEDAGDMEMTTAIGGILQGRTLESGSEEVDQDIQDADMDMTGAIGGILTMIPPTGTQQAMSIAPVSTKTPPASPIRTTSLPPATRRSIVASETGSPTITTRSPRTRGQLAKIDMANITPAKTPGTPVKQVTPKASRPTTPGKTPPAKSTALQRESTPKKLFQDEILASPAKQGNGVTSTSHFDATAENTMANAYAAISPSKRHISKLGFDKQGLGSPRVAELLDRRTSIGEQAGIFSPSKLGKRMIRFEDPKVMEAEIVKEHQHDERRESGHFILEQEADGQDSHDLTTSLKEAIGSMTPKKTPQKKNLKGRKSLAVGGAVGLLGKRPRELDDSDEDGTPRALQGREGSPVKRIRLQAPPSKDETIGRFAKPAFVPDSARATTPSFDAAEGALGNSTPKHNGHFKDAEALESARKPVPTMGQQTVPEEDLAQENTMEKIHLQDFLNMTSIRFMELNTTKRRHTVMPAKIDGSDGQNDKDVNPAKMFENAVVASACTVPMLELFQHSCRELKKYIAEGRGVIREIETDTFEENPPLFRAYMSASPAERAVMDNQFKHMKTHARLLSKGMWYEWRMKLLEGLGEALDSTQEGMKDDGVLLAQHEQAIQGVLPGLLEKQAALTEEYNILQARAAEFDPSTQDELDAARSRILTIDEEIVSKKQMIEQYRQKLHATEEDMALAQQEKSDCQASVRDAQRVREELRGWSVAEVNALKVKVDNLETKHGWCITSAVDTAMTMSYRGQLQLFFDAAAFADSQIAKKGQNSPISLTYMGDDASVHRRPITLTTQSRFFLQFMRAQLQCLSQSSTSIKSLLSFVSTGWDKACSISQELRALEFMTITDCAIRGDERLEADCSFMLPAAATKVAVGFEILVAIEKMEMMVKVQPRVKVTYGERYKEDRMTDFLKARVPSAVNVKQDVPGQWARSVRDLKKKLVEQGRKGEVKA